MHIASFGLALPLLFATSLAVAQTPTAPPADAAPAPAAPALSPPIAGVETPPAPTESAVEAEATPEDRSVYISISPIHLLGPIVELSAEVRLHRNIGVAVIGGYGSIKVAPISQRYKVWEIGGQFVGYPVGHFDHGMQLGVELLYLGVSGNDAANVVVANGAGLAAGPLIGYKLATKVGFSFNVQGGVQYVMARAEATSATGKSAAAEQTSVIPLLNANIGWSF